MWAPSSGSVSCIRRASATTTATMTSSPANTHRHDAYVVISPPIRGPNATAIAADAATRP